MNDWKFSEHTCVYGGKLLPSSYIRYICTIQLPLIQLKKTSGGPHSQGGGGGSSGGPRPPPPGDIQRVKKRYIYNSIFGR